MAKPDVALGELSDEELMRLYQEGEAQAFAILLERHGQLVLNFTYRFVADAELARDLTQDVFMRVIKGAAGYRRRAKFKTWLYTIARNTCIDAVRKKKHRKMVSLDAPIAQKDEGPALGDVLADDCPGSDARAANGQFRTALTKALETLPDEQREVFVMRQFQNLKFSEIAKIVGCPENTVKSRMRYALEALRTRLKEHESGKQP